MASKITALSSPAIDIVSLLDACVTRHTSFASETQSCYLKSQLGQRCLVSCLSPPSFHLQAWLLTDDHLRDSYPIGAPSCLLSPAVSYQSVASGRVQVGLDCGGRVGVVHTSPQVCTSLNRYCTIAAYPYFNKQGTQFWLWMISLSLLYHHALHLSNAICYLCMLDADQTTVETESRGETLFSAPVGRSCCSLRGWPPSLYSAVGEQVMGIWCEGTGCKLQICYAVCIGLCVELIIKYITCKFWLLISIT